MRGLPTFSRLCAAEMRGLCVLSCSGPLLCVHVAMHGAVIRSAFARLARVRILVILFVAVAFQCLQIGVSTSRDLRSCVVYHCVADSLPSKLQLSFVHTCIYVHSPSTETLAARDKNRHSGGMGIGISDGLDCMSSPVSGL